ncbi:lysine transporter LysE [Streptomyces lunaelactis]|uniref:Lysine transporter LysE n=1 Tax=Streptomyces lunaelactis TaxID=1535768 RepID=A0A2R4TDQ7_9ACTN|nr:LysE family translocator [Streptomyces lunaelactis]AVZ77259.1 lysine transporter LysE [Streptomyces lunaelactis]NUK83051.1 LysE family translocator [Streptomyces lunaelactis]NUL02509.1 LysE family translocator [Streptomyces lunaelactis]
MDAQLIAFIGVAAGMVAMPGADFTVVVRNALASRRAGVACAVGVAGGLVVHTALAVAGLAAVLVAVPVLYRTLQIVGGAYVLYLGIKAVRAALRPGLEVAEPDGAPAGGVRRSLRQGFLTNVLNPKAPVLFLSLLPQFVPEGAPVLPRTLLLATIVVLLALLWFPMVALLVDRLGGWLRRPRTTRAVEGVTGGALTALGATLLAEPLTH